MNKKVELARKLARLAAPGSGASDAERANAAIRCCELIAEGGFVIDEIADTPPERPTRKKPERDWRSGYDANGVHYSPPRKVKNPEFHQARAAFLTHCHACGRFIIEGDPVMRRTQHGVLQYIHGECFAKRAEW